MLCLYCYPLLPDYQRNNPFKCMTLAILSPSFIGEHQFKQFHRYAFTVSNVVVDNRYKLYVHNIKKNLMHFLFYRMKFISGMQLHLEIGKAMVCI